jgi:hypothetical protein
MAARRQIIDLQRLLAERFPTSPPSHRTIFHTGCDSLDQITGGGMPKGAITEVTSPKVSAGSATLIHRLIRAAQAENHFVALIDGCDSFDPQAIGNECLRYLLWIRCTKAFEAIKAADLLLRDGNFPLVILDLMLNPAVELRKIPQTSWYRLQRLVEATSSVCLVLNRHSIVSSAQLKLMLENSWSLPDLAEQTPRAQLQFHVQRSHFKSEVRDQRSEVS